MPDPALSRYVSYMRQQGLARTTVYTRNRTLERLRAWLGVPLVEATPERLAAWRASLAAGDQTVRGYVCDARQFYAWAVGAGLRQDNPAAGLPTARKVRRLPRPIARADLFRAVALAPQPQRVILVLAAWCGLRSVEIAGLRRECVLDTLSQPVLLVAAESTKGRRRERIVPLAPFPLGELAAYGLPAGGPVIPRRDGRAGPNQPHRISQLANAWLHSLEIAATLHQLRHWFGTEAWRARHDLRVVQELLGHADPATTAGYAAWDMAEAVDVVEALPVPPELRAAGLPRGGGAGGASGGWPG